MGRSPTRLLLVLLVALLAGACGEESLPRPDLADATAGADVARDDLAAAPYTCTYEPAGDYTPGLADMCDALAQTCTKIGEVCALTAEGTRCVAGGGAGCGEACQFLADCPAGSVCVGDPAWCRALCRTGDPCPAGTLCRPLAGRDDLGFCPPACSVIAQDCPAGLACYVVLGNQECAPPPQQPVAAGEVCAFSDACAPGLICQPAADPRCRVPCLADGGPSGCAAAEQCTPLPGLEPVGVCFRAAP
jgi:hypothetical protein